MVDDQYLFNNSIVRAVKVCEDQNRYNRSFYGCHIQQPDYECKRGWWCPRFDTDLSAFVDLSAGTGAQIT